ncbi:uncharacterized protein [Bos taurus]|uniref:uncharacterized protein isoform X2 n=1 Tax=Bos taurus TaxID=9913 RepID=UPI000572D063|nr:uncharacterized protein LOC100336777 isoform X2 [Bos taurus]
MSFQYRAMQLYITKQCCVFKNPFPQSALSHLFLSFVRFFSVSLLRGVGVVRGEIKTGKGSSPSWRFLSALTCGRGLEPTSGEGRGPKRRSILNGSNRKEASLARKRRNNILKGGTCKSGIEPRKAWEAPVIIEAAKSQDLEGELASWRPRRFCSLREYRTYIKS